MGQAFEAFFRINSKYPHIGINFANAINFFLSCRIKHYQTYHDLRIMVARISDHYSAT